MRTAERSGRSGGRVGGGAETSRPFIGYRVHDPQGRKFGRVKLAVLNARGGVEYLSVRLGSLGLRTVMIPVLDLVADESSQTLTLL